MRAAPRTAIVMAAGMGTRLRSMMSDQPKGFIQIGDETLIARCLRLVAEVGVERVVIVAGYRSDAYFELSRTSPAVEVIENPHFETTGSMASLACALEIVEEDFLLFESDLFYEERAVHAVCNRPEADVLLASDETGATDEVWIQADDRNCLVNMSKQSEDLNHVSGELVGIVKLSAPT
ncbi:phosphocholine cytidylyltransferase family protein, partial [Myxococcota bacterium]|nr:phosphocholine cytidylyltransferase family protein [Myxococcota bacterium]